MTTFDPEEDVPWEEEPWEQEIAQLLATLPEVEPPPGFFESAIDRPPHHSGRVLAAALGVSVTVFASAVVFGFVGPGQAELSLDWMTDRHETVETALRSGQASITPNVFVGADLDMRMVEPGEDPLGMPSGYEREVDLLTEDLRQAIYSRGVEAVSVFEQPGRIDTDALAADGLVPLPDTRAWYDPQRQLMVVETTDSAVAVVGLDEADMIEVLADAEPRQASAIEAAISELTAQLGFPD